MSELLADKRGTALVGHLTTRPLTGEADLGVTHQECINGTVSALQRLKCKIYEVSIQIE